MLSLVPPLARMERMLPALGAPHRPPLLVPAQGVRRGRVAFFVGCDAFGAAPPALALMRALKARFDPARVLSPGRFVGGI